MNIPFAIFDKKITTASLSIIFLVCVNSGYAFDWKKMHEEADKKDIKQALVKHTEDPKSQETLYELGLVYLNAYKNNEAESVFNAMLKDNPDSIEAKWALAEILRRRHELDKSESILKEIINKNPKFSPAYI
ncbi:MAG: tetratricopeptide repeat protein, partial [Candidatus Omnitrophica bacterium]|nr:tetratricopeptide repeat protein [Candidatus Omnitrophota bacterium]